MYGAARLMALLVLSAGTALSCGTQQPPLPPCPELEAQTSLPSSPDPAIAIVGDSYTSGTKLGGQRDRSWPALVDKDLQAEGHPISMTVAAEGGAGYVHPGNRKGSTFDQLVNASVKPDDKVVVIFGSRNDMKEPRLEVATAACTALASAAKIAKAAKILVIAPPWIDGSPPEELRQLGEILRHQATGAGPRVTFHDPVQDGWFADRPDFIATDRIHPTDEGHKYMAARIRPFIEQALAANS